MNVAILTISSLSLVASVGTLVIMYKTAKKLDAAGKKVKDDVETFKAKTDRNVKRLRATLNEMEL